MKAVKLEILVIDFDGLGEDEIGDVISESRYANDCISPSVISSKSVDIGEWYDGHPLNNSNTRDAEIKRLFG